MENKVSNKKDWFVDWFNTSYYHLLYQNRDQDEAKRFIKNIINHLHLPQESRILDLACGKGRHAIEISSYGYDVTGIDLSEESIKEAQTHENQNLSFFVHDMRHHFRINYFNAIFNLFTSFGYFENTRDNYRCIEVMARGLKDQGIMVIDFMNVIKVLNNLVPKEIIHRGDIDFNITRELIDNRIVKTISFEDEGESFQYQEKVEAIRLSDFQSFLDVAGLKVVSLWGNYDLEDFDAENSDRLIIVAKKG